MSDKTAQTQLSVINMIFRYAVRRGEIPFNPARDIEVPKDLPKSTRTVPTDAEINAIRASWDTQAAQMANWFLYTGLRRNELLALEWEDVDIKARAITVSKSIYRGMDGKTHLKEPKTEAGIRTVPLLDALAKHLTPGSGLIFRNRYGTYITDAQFEKLWREFQSEKGITCTPHQLRHATVTMYCEAVDDGRLSLQDVQHIVGHANYQTTMNIYNHYRKLREEKARAAVLDLDYKTGIM
jgi:integrase